MNANEPAFPYADKSVMHDGQNFHNVVGGLTKREYFAAMAVQGLASSKSTALDDARMAVALADALLAELARTEPKEKQ